MKEVKFESYLGPCLMFKSRYFSRKSFRIYVWSGPKDAFELWVQFFALFTTYVMKKFARKTFAHNN